MRIPRPKFSIAQLMVGVACLAFLSPDTFPPIIWAMVPVFVIYILPIVAFLAVDDPRNRQTVLTSLAILCFSVHWIAVGFLIFSPRDMRTSAGAGGVFLLIHLLIFQPVQIMGPLNLARQWFDQAPIFTGDILWAWSAFLWIAMFTIPVMSHRDMTLEYLVSFARASSSLVLWLIFFGKRPVRNDRRWSHYLGWAFIEYHAIGWGLYGARRLFH